MSSPIGIPPLILSTSRLNDNSDPLLRYYWTLESHLITVRWAVIPLCLARILFPPTVSWQLLVPLALLLALGNMVIRRLVARTPSVSSLRLIQLAATVLEWSFTLGTIAALSSEANSNAPVFLVLRILADTIRFGLLGIIASAVSSQLITVFWVGSQVMVFRAIDNSTAWSVLLRWEMVFLVTSFIMAGLVLVGKQWYEELNEQLQSPDSGQSAVTPALNEEDTIELQRIRAGLSRQEWKVLQLLAKDELATFSHLAEQLNISEATIKTHTQRIGKKLGINTGSRRAVVAIAREQGLIHPL